MLLDELKNLSLTASRKTCVVGRWISSQDPEIATVLADLATKPNFNATAAFNVVRKNEPNIPFKRTAFGEHMRKVCACQAT